MARKRHTAEEIVAKLRQVDVLTSQGRPVADAVRAIGVSEVTYYRWRSEYGGLKGDQVKRLKALEAENARPGARPGSLPGPHLRSLPDKSSKSTNPCCNGSSSSHRLVHEAVAMSLAVFP